MHSAKSLVTPSETRLTTKDEVTGTLGELLTSSEYNLSESLRNTIEYAIALSPTPEMNAADAMGAIRRHLTGFGIYGGFPIIVPLHGGGGELSQAFCRAAAVKGATYILGREIRDVSIDGASEDYPVNVHFNVSDAEEMPTVRCKRLVRLAQPHASECVEITRTVVVVEGIIDELFGIDVQHSEAALIVIPPGVMAPDQMPLQIILHGGGIGECPQGQCTSISSLFNNNRGNVL
jgi:Rab proteins geranylgeranyltransferase component A